jgi:capsular polysaccharide biosynthesis protein
MFNDLSVLRRCEAMWGAYEIIHEDPSRTVAENVVALPYAPGGAWGIYNRSGRVLDDAIDRHGPDGTPADRRLVVPVSTLRNADILESETYLYGGFVNLHFGHFIANTLPRLWTIVRDGTLKHPVLFHGQGTPVDWFTFPFIRDFFAALGISPDNVKFVDRPMRINRLIIPHPAFQEQHFAHRVFGQLCRNIGDNLLKNIDTPIELHDTPVYLSKTGLSSGVGRFANEDTVVQILQSAGLEIQYPERLTPAEQISIFRDRKIILGPLGSAFHNSIFCATQANIICIAPSSHPNSNFMMLDCLAGINAQYFCDPGTSVDGEPDGKFLTSLRFSDPKSIAEDLLKLVQ